VSSAPSSLPEALSAVLLDPEEATALQVHGRTQAAVLVALYDGGAVRSPHATGGHGAAGDLHAVFTRRRHDLRSHAGEISFPGGRRDDGEDDLRVTALREAEEEIGLPREAVRIVGALTPTPTVATSYAVYPFVGVIEPGLAWTPSAREVDEVLELRLADLRAAHDRRRLLHRGIPFRTDVYAVADQRVIWGATARIVADLLARLDPLLADACG
jgi:8-oxo-dGTP pyrophosphatase MutT (NUDIX family)